MRSAEGGDARDKAGGDDAARRIQYFSRPHFSRLHRGRRYPAIDDEEIVLILGRGVDEGAQCAANLKHALF
jgi:hypothetical protein